MDGRREVRDGSRLRTVRKWSVDREGTVLSREGAIPVTLAAWTPWAAGVLELRLDEDRCRRERVCCELLRGGEVWSPSVGSLKVEVEEVVEATEAVCCRRRESSRVKRFTCQ